MVHAKSILTVLPNLLRVSQVVGIHEDIPKAEGPLSAKLGLFHGIETGLVNCQSCLGHAGQGTDNSRVSDSSMWNFPLNFPDIDHLMGIHAGVGRPIKVPHGVELASLGLTAPSSHERAMDTLAIEEVLEELDHSKEVIFNIVKQVWVFDFE